MFRIPTIYLKALYSCDPSNAVVCSARYEYSLHCNVFSLDGMRFDVIQRRSLSDPSDCQQRLVNFGSLFF